MSKAWVRFFHSLLFIALSAMLACGGAGSVQPGNLNSGSWVITGNSSANQGQLLRIAGVMTQNGTSVSANMAVVNNAVDCFSLYDGVTLSGSFSGDNLTLTSAPVNGNVVVLNLKGTGSALSGTYTVSGGGVSCGDNGTVTATVIPPLTGTWTGTLYHFDGTTFGSVWIELTQGPFAAVDGYAPLSGTATVVLQDPNNPLGTLPPRTCPLSTSEGYISTFSGTGLLIRACFLYQGALVTGNGGIGFNGVISLPPDARLFLYKVQ